MTVKPIRRRSPKKLKVIYIDEDGLAYDRQPTKRGARQITRQDLNRLKVRYSVILEKVE